MGTLRLETLSSSNIVEANGLSLKPGQEQFIAPATYVAESGSVNPMYSWQRVARNGEDVVGFVHGHFEPDHSRKEFRACLWKINVDAEAQGTGIGRFLIAAIAEEARSRGVDQVNVFWESGDSGPEAFFHRLGFTEIGHSEYGDVIGALKLQQISARSGARQ